jgi:hypothetical protein
MLSYEGTWENDAKCGYGLFSYLKGNHRSVSGSWIDDVSPLFPPNNNTLQLALLVNSGAQWLGVCHVQERRHCRWCVSWVLRLRARRIPHAFAFLSRRNTSRVHITSHSPPPPLMFSRLCRNFQRRFSRGSWPHNAVRPPPAPPAPVHACNAHRRASGSELRASFVKGKAQGQGLYTYNDGSRYVGQFVNSQREGSGIFKCETLAAFLWTFAPRDSRCWAQV